MTASRVQIGISQDYLETSKLTSGAGTIHREGTFNASPTDVNAKQEIDATPQAARVILYDASGSPISTEAVGNTVALITHDEIIDTEIVNLHAHDLLSATTTLSAAIVAGDTSITVSNAGGFSVGGRVDLVSSAVRQFSLPVITGISGTTITLDGPLDCPYAISGTTIRHVSTNMNVSGSLGAPVKYVIAPPPGIVWHMKRIIFSIIHSTAADDSKFGSLTALTNGVVFRSNTNAQGFATIGNWKANSDFISDMYDVNYSSKAGGGKFGTSGRWSFADTAGSVIRLEGDHGDEIEVLIQDNLTALTKFEINFQGHLD